MSKIWAYIHETVQKKKLNFFLFKLFYQAELDQADYKKIKVVDRITSIFKVYNFKHILKLFFSKISKQKLLFWPFGSSNFLNAFGYIF